MKRFFYFSLLMLCAVAAFSQTNPPVQNIPLSINFGTANYTPPFTNMAAWTVTSMPIATQAAAEASTPNGNVPAGNLISGAPVGATPGGGQYGDGTGSNGRLTIMTSGNTASGTTQAVVSINTTGISAISINYDLSLQVSNPRTVGLVLQYRLGTSGAFTTIAGSAVAYTSGSTNGGDADGNTDWDSYSFTLPAAAENQPEVQLRWATWRGGAGNSSGIGIDNINIGAALPSCSQPAAQPTALNLNATPTSVSGSFTAAAPGPDAYIVIRSLSPTLSPGPVDGTTYPEASLLGGGVVVSNGITTSFNDIGLTSNTSYYYFIFSYNSNNCLGGPNYLDVNPLTDNTTTPPLPACTTPPAAPTNLVLTPFSSSVNGTFTAAAGANNYLVVRSPNSTLSFSPVNGTTYTPGQNIGVDRVVSYNGNTSFYASGLTASTTYYFFVFAANGNCTGEPFYNSTALNANATTTGGGGGGIPTGYYDAATGLTCGPLKTALFNIISANYNSLSYTPGVWDAYQTTDMHRNDANTADIIWDMYSDNPTGPEPYVYTYGTNQCGNYSNEGDCYNREHSFPKSWFKDASPMYSDLNHLFPTDGKVNGIRENYPYGEVSSPAITTQNGGKRGLNTFPGFTGTVFEPINAYKGDLARAHLYMVTRYENLVAGWTGNGNANDVLNGTAYPALDDWDIKLMYKWHTQDPVSQKEIDRNNAVYALQGNRNPFIDHPEYVAEVWQCSGLIPVTMISFSAQKTNEAVLLKWETTRETSFKEYEIQRSTDGVNFYKAGTVAGRNLANYNFTDNKLPVAKNVYYRLKMIDIDGKFTYSKIVSVRLNDYINNAIAYPNPTAGKLNIKLQQSFTEKTFVTVTDLAGRNVLQSTVQALQNNFSLDVSHLQAGRYFIKIISGNEIINQSFVVIK